jgi:hypothetical protein
MIPMLKYEYFHFIIIFSLINYIFPVKGAYSLINMANLKNLIKEEKIEIKLKNAVFKVSRKEIMEKQK